MLVDVHAHLDHERFKKDLDKVIERCRKNDVVSVITSGVNVSSNRNALELSEKYDIVNCSLGIYPVDALAAEIKPGLLPRDVEIMDVEKELEFIKKKKNKIIAIGECGLDYHWIKDKNEEQKKVFEKVIKLAEQIKKPLVIHSRKAEKDAVELLESSNVKKIIMHCFNGNFKLVKRCEDNGWSFSIPPIILNSMHFQGLVNLVSLSSLLTETDCPYLAPPGKKRNEPMFVKETIKKISEIKKLNIDEVKRNIFMNYQRVFMK